MVFEKIKAILAEQFTVEEDTITPEYTKKKNIAIAEAELLLQTAKQSN